MLTATRTTLPHRTGTPYINKPRLCVPRLQKQRASGVSMDFSDIGAGTAWTANATIDAPTTFLLPELPALPLGEPPGEPLGEPLGEPAVAGTVAELAAPNTPTRCSHRSDSNSCSGSADADAVGGEDAGTGTTGDAAVQDQYGAPASLAVASPLASPLDAGDVDDDSGEARHYIRTSGYQQQEQQRTQQHTALVVVVPKPHVPLWLILIIVGVVLLLLMLLFHWSAVRARMAEMDRRQALTYANAKAMVSIAHAELRDEMTAAVQRHLASITPQRQQPQLLQQPQQQRVPQPTTQPLAQKAPALQPPEVQKEQKPAAPPAAQHHTPLAPAPVAETSTASGIPVPVTPILASVHSSYNTEAAVLAETAVLAEVAAPAPAAATSARSSRHASSLRAALQAAGNASVTTVSPLPPLLDAVSAAPEKVKSAQPIPAIPSGARRITRKSAGAATSVAGHVGVAARVGGTTGTTRKSNRRRVHGAAPARVVASEEPVVPSTNVI